MALLTLPTAASAQRVGEIGIQALGVVSDSSFLGGGFYGALRGAERGRLAATVSLGTREGRLAGRAELLAHFLLSPRKTAGAGVYAGGGVAASVSDRSSGYLVLLIGVERSPGGSAGWAVELGVGGGVRLAAGYRWRRGVPR